MSNRARATFRTLADGVTHVSGGKQAAAVARAHARAVAVLAGVSFAAFAAAQDQGIERPAAATLLAEGATIESAPHQPKDPVTYELDARRGATYLVVVEQHGLDFHISVESPKGEVTAYNSPLFRDEPELVLIEQAAAGRYRFTVESEEPTYAAGSHSISVVALDDGRSPDEFAALRAMSEGARANREGRGKDALAAYEHAAEVWRALGDTRREAQAVYGAAMAAYWSVYDWRGAATHAQAAAALYERLGARALYANATFAAGYSLMEVAQNGGTDGQSVFDEALTAFDASRAIHESLGNDFELAQVDNFTGLAYFNRGQAETRDYRLAEQHYVRAAETFASLGEWREALNVRMNLAALEIDEGYAAAAARTLEAILVDIPEGGARLLRGIVLTNLGVAYRDSGAYDAALRVLSEAVEIHAELDQFNWEGFALRVLGMTYRALGVFDRADEYLRRALDKSPDDGRIRSSVLSGLGDLAYRNERYVEALDWDRQAVQSTSSASDRARRQAFVARDLVALDRYEEAVVVAAAAKSDAETLAVTRADLALELGRAYLGLGRPEDADAQFVDALAVYHAVGLRPQQADTLNGRALAAAARGDLSAAIEFGWETLRRIEGLRTNVAAPELRAFYSAANRNYYETQIELLVAAHEDTGGEHSDYLLEALSVSERARARRIIDMLAEASIRLEQGMPQSLVDRERGLYEELAALRYRVDRVLANAGADAAELGALVARMTEIEHKLTVLATEARQDAAAHSSVSAATPLTAAQLQASLDARSVLVQYALGKPRSFAWVVTTDSVDLVSLADRETIEEAARRTHEDLKTYQPVRPRDDARNVRLAELSGLILEPLAGLLDGKERVIVAADGALGYVPFGLLPISSGAATVRMLEASEIVSVPSMSAMVAQRERVGSRPSRTLAVFADPVFSAADARLPHDPITARPEAGPERLDELADAAELERLPATSLEAELIAARVPQNSRFVATGFDATRARVLAAPLGDYRVVHFATHGLVDSRYPGLSALVLSRFDEAGRPQNGLLRLRDIYGLRLNAELVVLSGCDTALGREIRGEGLIGLVDGFLYAGAQSLVVSLWQVPDRATAELMTRFYAFVLTDGLRPAEALRRAQRSIAAERRWSDPYFWGAFVVLGDA